MTVRKRVLVLATAMLMAGSALTVGSPLEPAAAAGGTTACKSASGRAMVYERQRAIGYLYMRMTFCWHVLNGKPTAMAGAKINQIKVKMPPSQTEECLLVRTFGRYDWRASTDRINSQRWRITAVGDYSMRIYTDTAPRDCKHQYAGTKQWRPVVAITVGVGGGVQVSAPPVS